jgi:hypothetical protein
MKFVTTVITILLITTGVSAKRLMTKKDLFNLSRTGVAVAICPDATIAKNTCWLKEKNVDSSICLSFLNDAADICFEKHDKELPNEFKVLAEGKAAVPKLNTCIVQTMFDDLKASGLWSKDPKCK